MIDGPTDTRAEATERFAATLRGLRESVGNPSFREMSGRSQAISHTTLHEAAQGHRFPSWATTVEFVKACGADPAEYKQQWDETNRAVRSAERTVHPAATAPPAEPGAAPVPNEPAEQSTVDVRPRGARRALIGAAAVIAIAAGVLAVVAATGDDSTNPDQPGKQSPANAQQLRSVDCPISQRNPPAAPPRHPGDASAFIADIKLPDCTHVARGHEVLKVWRLKNTGTHAWSGYTLHRVDLPERRDQCQTITDIPIPKTGPGETVDIRVDVMTPQAPGFCFVRFKMQDSAGQLAFPGRRPVNFQLIVD